MNLSQPWTVESFGLCFASLNDSCIKTVYSPVLRAPLYLLFTVTIILIVFGNLWVICTIFSFQQLQTPTNYLIVSMAVSDLLLGSFVMPPSMIRSLETCWYFGDFFTPALILRCVMHLFCTSHSSQLTVTMQSVSRSNITEE